MSTMPASQPKKYRAFPPNYLLQNYLGPINPAFTQFSMYGSNPAPYPPEYSTEAIPEFLADIKPESEHDTLSAEQNWPMEQSAEQSNEEMLSVGISRINQQMDEKHYPAMHTIKETLFLWTQIGAVLFFLAGIVNIAHLWIWVHSSDYYFQHWQILVVELIPRTLYISALCSLCMYWFVICRWYLAQLRLLSRPDKAQLPRYKREIILLFFPIINCWGLPQVLTELLIIIRRHPQPILRISYRLYIVTMRKIRFWSITWLALWMMTLAEILASCLVSRPDSIALNDEFRIVWLLCISLHICYTYKILKILTLLAEVVSGSAGRSEENFPRNSSDQPLDIMAVI